MEFELSAMQATALKDALAGYSGDRLTVTVSDDGSLLLVTADGDAALVTADGQVIFDR